MLREHILTAVLIAGIVLSAYLVYYHYNLRSGASGWCNISQFVNCSDAILSSYSEIMGIPLGFFGIAWFSIALLIHLSPRLRLPLAVNSRTILLIWCVVGLSAIVYLVFIEILILHALCILCTAAHLLMLCTLVLAILDIRMAYATSAELT